MRILFTNTGPWGTGSATVVDAVSLDRQMLQYLGCRFGVIYTNTHAVKKKGCFPSAQPFQNFLSLLLVHCPEVTE